MSHESKHRLLMFTEDGFRVTETHQGMLVLETRERFWLGLNPSSQVKTTHILRSYGRGLRGD